MTPNVSMDQKIIINYSKKLSGIENEIRGVWLKPTPLICSCFMLVVAISSCLISGFRMYLVEDL